MSSTVTDDSPSSESSDPRDRWVARVPVFYGWVMLPVAMIAQVATSPGQSFAIAVFNQSFTEALQLSEKQLTGAFGVGTLLASFTLPFFGALMDRWGVRRATWLAVICLGLACFLTSHVQSLLTLCLAFLLLRMFGQGALTLYASNTLAMWFGRRLGAAMGMMSVGCVLLMGQVPPTVSRLIDWIGWRPTYALLGVLVWVVMVPILVFAFRSRPEDIGQTLDGDSPEDPEKGKDDPADSLNLRQAIGTRAYWIMSGVQAIWAMVVTALVFNVQKVFSHAGLDVGDAGGVLTWFFCAIAATQLVGGFAADRCKLNHLIFASVAGMSASMSVFLFGGTAWIPLAYVLMGLSQGVLGATANTLWARYYGRWHVGKIRGSVNTAMVAGSATGPFLMGLSFDLYGSYAPSFWLFAGLTIALLSVALLATPPVRGAGQREAWGSAPRAA